MPDEKTCEWKPDGEDCFETGCHKHFEFSDGGPGDNGFEFCPFCGGALVIPGEGDS